MKTKYLIQSTIRQMLSRKVTFFATTLLVCAAFLVIGFQSIIIGSVYYQKHLMKKMITQKLEDTYFLNLQKYAMINQTDMKKLSKLVDKMNHLDGIKLFGVYSNENLYFEKSGESSHEALFISSSLCSLCRIQTVDKKELSFDPINDREVVYVGYNLRQKFPVGYEFTDETTGINYVVAGILEKDSRWLQDNETFMDLYVTLDNYFVASQDIIMKQTFCRLTGIDVFCFVAEPDVNAEQLKQTIFSTATECGLDLYAIDSIPEKLNMNKKELFADPATFYMAFAMLVMCVIGIIVSSMINIFLKKSNIGIMYAIGYSVSDIRKMIILENIIKVVLSFLISYGFWIVNEKTIYPDISIIRVMTPWLILGAVLIIIIGSLLPIRQLNRLYPATLIGGKE